MRALAAGALGVSLFLTIQGAKSGPIPGCGPDSGFDCASVLASKWSKWFGFPVSELAMALYLVALAAMAFIGPRATTEHKRFAWRVLVAVAVMVIGAALWFVAVQVFAIGKICNWCMIAHTCGFVLGVMLLIKSPSRGRGMLAIGAVGVSMLIVGQLLQEPPPTHVTSTWASAVADADEGDGQSREITLLGGRIRHLKTHDYPIVGSPDAEHVAVYIFDYTCPHCHEQHKNLDAARERYGNSLAIIPMVMPLDSDCNPEVTTTKEQHTSACELAKLSLAVFVADRTKFEAFHEWMFDAEGTRGVDESQAKAVELVGEAKLAEAMNDPWIDAEIMKHIGLYNIVSQMINHRAIPMIVVRAMVVAGQPSSPEELFEAMESKQGGVIAPSGAAPLPAPSQAEGESQAAVE